MRRAERGEWREEAEATVAERIRDIDGAGALANDFKEFTKYLSREASWYALDSLACSFHNRGHELAGNTEASDVRWLAGCLSQRLDHGRRFDQAAPERQQELMNLASAAIKELPGLAERISHRYLSMAKATRFMSDIYHRQTEQMQKKIR